MPDYPRGTVAFLFTDIEGSTQRWEQNADTMLAAVQRHLALLDDAITAHHGVHFKTIGDAVQAAFPTARDAFAAAVAAQRALADEPWPETTGPLRVRMALHAGSATPAHGDYLAPSLNRLARLLATGSGGQVLLTDPLRRLLDGWLPDGVTLRDLGRHRLRDLLEAEEVWQAVVPGFPDQFPPLKSLEGHPANLPIQPNALVGRETEVATLTGVLTRQDVHLVTVTGPGGTGKTRLALQAAAEALDAFPDGVFLVDLAPVTDPALVIPTIAATLGVHERANEPLRATLVAWLAPRTLLLLLDNLEHLLPAASELAALLTACPTLTILATSREPLRLRAEHEIPVAPLALPASDVSPTELANVPAVALFVQRAEAANPRFALTAENAASIAAICRKLDGLPLAIELAAARLKLLPPPALLDRLDRRLPLLTGGARDLPARQRTLRDTIAWSYDLLAPEDQSLFQRLGVVGGGWTFAAAEAVGNPAGTTDVFAGLASLVDKSLVRQTAPEAAEPRFAMLETIREFALERLDESADAEQTREFHAAYYVSLAEEAEPYLTGPEQTTWLAQLETEHSNLRAALSWSIERGPAMTALRLAGALWRFWYVRGHVSEGRSWLERVLACVDGALPAARAKALRGAGMLAESQGDYDRATAAHEASLALWREMGNEREIARSLDDLGNVAHDQGAFDRAEALHEQAVALSREVGDQRGLAAALHNLGTVALYRGQYERAATLYGESLALMRAIEDTHSLGTVLSNLGIVATRQGDYTRAAALYEESLALRRLLGDRQGIAATLSNLAELAWWRGDEARAGGLHTESLQITREMGDQRTTARTLYDLGEMALARGDLSGAAALLKESMLLFHQVGDRLAIADCLEMMGELLRASGRPAPAARLLGAAAALREAIVIPVEDHRRAAYNHTIASTRAALGEDAYTAAWTVGRLLSWEAAVTEALARVNEVTETHMSQSVPPHGV